MKYYVFVTRDKKLGAYDEPQFKREDAEHVVEMTARSLKYVPEGQRDIAADKALYALGTFNDITGKFDLLPEPEKLIDYEDYLPRKADVDDGKGKEA